MGLSTSSALEALEEGGSASKILKRMGKDTGKAPTGGPTGANYVDKASPKAIRLYEEIAAADGDVASIAQRLGVDKDIVVKVKSHVFKNEYDLPVPICPTFLRSSSTSRR